MGMAAVLARDIGVMSFNEPEHVGNLGQVDLWFIAFVAKKVSSLHRPFRASAGRAFPDTTVTFTYSPANSVGRSSRKFVSSETGLILSFHSV